KNRPMNNFNSEIFNSSINDDKYISIIIRINSIYISECDEILNEYKDMTGEIYNYDFRDKIMMSLLMKHGQIGINFKIICIKNYIFEYLIKEVIILKVFLKNN